MSDESSVPVHHLADPDRMRQAITSLLDASGFDPEHSQLKQTPERVVEAWQENLLSGYASSPEQWLSGGFPADGQGVVVLQGVDFYGMCPHHLLPFHGKADVAYLPGERVVGFSNLAELVHCFTRRFTLQETATQDIATALMNELGAKAAGCRLVANQLCMMLRTPGTASSPVKTEVLLGDWGGRYPW